jgi:hypothetical protein
MDIIAKAEPNSAGNVLKTTAKGSIHNNLGGVGRNVAEAAHRSLPATNNDILLICPVGKDQFATQIRATMSKIGMRTDGLVEITEGRTPVINMLLLGDGSLLGGVADVSITDMVSPKEVLFRWFTIFSSLNRSLGYCGFGTTRTRSHCIRRQPVSEAHDRNLPMGPDEEDPWYKSLSSGH